MLSFQIEAMYKKAHAAIRENPEAKKSEKQPFKGKRFVDDHLKLILK